MDDALNWRRYNEALVRREEELEEANRGRVGSRYDYLDSLIKLLGFMGSTPSKTDC